MAEQIPYTLDMGGSIWIDFDDYNDSAGYTPGSIFVLVSTAASFFIAKHFTNWQTALKFSGAIFVAALILAWTIPRLVEHLADRQEERQALRYELKFETSKQVILGKNDLRHRRKISIHLKRMTRKYMRNSIRELRSSLKYLKNAPGHEEQIVFQVIVKTAEDSKKRQGELRNLLKHQDFNSAVAILNHHAFHLACARYLRNLLALNRREEIKKINEVRGSESDMVKVADQIIQFESEHPLTWFSQREGKQSVDSRVNPFGSGQAVHTSKMLRGARYR